MQQMNRNCKKEKPYFYEVMLAAIAIATALLLTLNVNLFGDDFITIEQIRNYDYLKLMHNLRYDAHPPVFYTLLKGWSYLAGTTIVGLKSFNAFCYIALIAASYWGGRLMYGRKFALIATYTLALFPCMLNNPLLFIRMYMVAALFVMLTATFAYLLYIKPCSRNKCLFLIFSLIACFTHYYATFFSGLIHFFLYVSLIKKEKNNWKQCVVYAAICLVAFLLWLPTFLKQLALKQETIVDQTSLVNRIVKSIVFPFHTGSHLPVKDYLSYATTIVLLLATIVLIGITIWFVSKGNCKFTKVERNASLISIGLPITIMTGLVLVGSFTKPIWFGNYITLFFPVMALGLGFLVWKLDDKRITVCWFVLLSICFIQKLYLQSKMCQDTAYENYLALYEAGTISSDDTIIEANQRTSAYFIDVPQYKAGIDRPKDWYSFQYDHIKIVPNYESILKDKNSFFSTVELTDSIYPTKANGFKLVKEWHFKSQYYDFIDVELYQYKRNGTDCR